MPRPAERPELARVIDLFPGRGALVRRLYLADQSFRGACEDYALAQESVARLKESPEEVHRRHVDDYMSVIADLEGELAAMLARATGKPLP